MLWLFCGIHSKAETITVTAGNLINEIGDNKKISSLTINGSINASDLEFISENLTNLKTLDLRNASVEPYAGQAFVTAQVGFKADALPPYCLMGSQINELVLPSNLKEIGDGALSSSSITSIILPSTVTYIGRNAFTDCKSLVDIDLPSSVNYIGEGGFKDCSSLKSLVIKGNVNSVSKSCFEGCTSLSSLEIPATVSIIYERAFMDCSSLRTINLPLSLTEIGDLGFYGTGLTEVVMEDCENLDSIGDFAFAKCADLQSVRFPDQTVRLGKGLFFDDASLVSVNLAKGLTLIPAFTFKGNEAVTDGIRLPESVTKIGDYALSGWINAYEIDLPSDLERLGTNAMSNWPNLKKINASGLSSVPELGEDVWHAVNQSEVKLIVADQTYESFLAAEQWKEFSIIRLSEAGDSGLNNVINDNITIAFADNNIIIQSKTNELTGIQIFDISGKTIFTTNPASHAIILDTSSWQGNVVILHVSTQTDYKTLKLSL